MDDKMETGQTEQTAVTPRKRGRQPDPEGRHRQINLSLPESLIERMRILHDDTGDSVSAIAARALKVGLP